MSHAVAVTPPHAYEWACSCARWKLACASMIPCRSHFLAELRIADHHDALHAPRPTPHTSTATTATPHGCHLYHPVSPTSYCYHKYPSHTITTTLPPPMPPPHHHNHITTLPPRDAHRPPTPPHYHHQIPLAHYHNHSTTTRYPQVPANGSSSAPCRAPSDVCGSRSHRDCSGSCPCQQRALHRGCQGSPCGERPTCHASCMHESASVGRHV